MNLKSIPISAWLGIISASLFAFAALFALSLSSSNLASGVANPLGGEPFQLDGQRGFLIMTSLAAVSFYLSEFVLEDPKLDFYDLHTEYYSGLRGTSVLAQGFGIERAMSNWFTLGLETTLQHLFRSGYSATGLSINARYRWYFL